LDYSKLNTCDRVPPLFRRDCSVAIWTEVISCVRGSVLMAMR
jgi:hypothetical protein